MKPGERVSLIKKLAAHVAEMASDEVSLVLRQFGLSYATRSFEFVDPFNDVVYSIEDAPDDNLLGLHEYFFGEVAPSPRHTPQTAVEGIWEAGKLRLFLSHTHP